MASDVDYDSRARRRRYVDDDDRGPRDRDDHRSRRKESDRDRDRPRSRDRRERRRSRTPDSSRRRDRGRDRDRDRDRRRDRSRDDNGDDDDDDDDDKTHRRRRHRDRTEDDNDDKASPQEPRRSPVKRSGPLPSQEDSWAVTKGEEPEKPKEKPNYGNTGVLAAASNTVVSQADGTTTVTLKYHEPPEARKPPPRDLWKLYIFKGDDVVDTIDLGLRSCWLVGRDRAVVDLPAEHPSISKQHAVIQFRYTERRNEFGDKVGRVRPYIIDLESANGTELNEGRIPDSRYLELRNKDVVKFGHSSREYVFMLAPRD